jgi:hypothetical protein
MASLSAFFLSASTFPQSLVRTQCYEPRLCSVPDLPLSSRAMLCSLSIGMWSARKHDPEAAEEIAQRHGAQADAGRYRKVLLPNYRTLTPNSGASRFGPVNFNRSETFTFLGFTHFSGQLRPEPSSSGGLRRRNSTREFCSDDHHGPRDGNLLTLPPDFNVLTCPA